MDYQHTIGHADADLGTQLYGLAQKCVSTYINEDTLTRLMKDQSLSEFEAIIINVATIEMILDLELTNEEQHMTTQNSLAECLINDFFDRRYSSRLDFSLPERMEMHRRELRKLVKNEKYLAPQSTYHLIFAPLESEESIDDILSRDAENMRPKHPPTSPKKPMLRRYTQPNTFGGTTWEIELHSLFRIFINEADKDSYVVEFKEHKWIRKKTHFSFMSEAPLEETIDRAFERAYEFFQGNGDFAWTSIQKENKKREVLNLLNRQT